MSTVFLALALLMGLGVVTFAIALGLAGLGVVVSWLFPLTPFQGTLLHLVLFALAVFLLGVTLLFERIKDTLLATADAEEESLAALTDGAARDGGDVGAEKPLPSRRHDVKVGRNDPCPCGSGKKYKFCCLAKL
jgi:hypothetical protein